MSFAVVDASVTFNWCFADQASEATDRLLDLVGEHGALVPGLWFLEVANGLVPAERRRKITAADADVRLELLSSLPIMIDQNTVGRAWTDVLRLARAERLSAYDAADLELAARRGLPLYTWDNALAEAARRHGVAVSP